MIQNIVILLLLASFGNCLAQKLSPLAGRPDWHELEAYQETITRTDFIGLLENIYAPGGAWKKRITVEANAARITTRPGQPELVLRFASSSATARAIPRFWKGRHELNPSRKKPLEGLKIAIDPGHLGGAYAKIEERWFQIGDSKPVTEGDMTLYVARLMVPRLEALGAEVFLTRSRPGPVTTLRPEKLQREARMVLAEKGQKATPQSVDAEARRLFYRVGEIRHRARLVNEQIRPDLVICLHFNAEAWGDAARPQLTDKNHLHFLVTGAFSEEELENEDVRFNMLKKLLDRAYPEELAVTESIAVSMAAATNLPPFEYKGRNAVKTGKNPYIWGRNLLANRLFACPVVFIEPYVMNSREVFARIQLGDYEGRRNVGGTMRKSLYREYADALIEGILNYYSRQP